MNPQGVECAVPLPLNVLGIDSDNLFLASLFLEERSPIRGGCLSRDVLRVFPGFETLDDPGLWVRSGPFTFHITARRVALTGSSIRLTDSSRMELLSHLSRWVSHPSLWRSIFIHQLHPFLVPSFHLCQVLAGPGQWTSNYHSRVIKRLNHWFIWSGLAHHHHISLER